MARNLQLTRGYVAIIDDADYARVSEFKWSACVARRKDGSVCSVYGRRKVLLNGKRQLVTLHRFILGVVDPEVQVDHINHDSLDNRRANLRPCTPAQNQWNQRLAIDNISGKKGVGWDSGRAKWTASICCNGKQRWLGRFSDKQEAANAYILAAQEMYGEFANVS